RFDSRLNQDPPATRASYPQVVGAVRSAGDGRFDPRMASPRSGLNVELAVQNLALQMRRKRLQVLERRRTSEWAAEPGARHSPSLPRSRSPAAKRPSVRRRAGPDPVLHQVL